MAYVLSEALNFYHYIIVTVACPRGTGMTPKMCNDSSTFVCILCIKVNIKEDSIIADCLLVVCQKMSFINMPDDDTDFV